MGVTDEQYSQILQYVAGEMEAAERKSFEESLKTNEELAAEVKRCRQIQVLFASAEKKLEQHYQLPASEKKESEDGVANMIAQARADWERENEAETPVQKKNSLHRNKREGGGTIGLPGWVWLAAAVAVGLAGLGVWLIVQKEPSPQSTAQHNESKNGVTVKEEKPVLPQADTAAKKTDGLVTAEATEKKTDTKALFARYFKPDTAPADREPQQEEAFAFYTAKNYPAAIEDFEMWKAALETRGDTERAVNTPFYIHYYLAMSYLSDGRNTKQAIAGLKTAIQETSNPTLKQKARWYLALADLTEGNIPEARTLLQQLKSSTAYGPKATELLQELNGNN